MDASLPRRPSGTPAGRRLPTFFARSGWTRKHVAVAVVLSAGGIFATLDAWADVAQTALRDEEASHIFLVPVVAVWLAFARRARLRSLRPLGHALGPALIAAGWGLYLIGYAYLIDVFWHGGAVIVLGGCIVTGLGAGTLRAFLPSFVVLGFLVPVPGLVRQSIAVPLQSATASVTQRVLEVLGADVLRSGNVLTVNGFRIAIVEACNGLRMVFALVLVSFAFAYGTALRQFVRVTILILSPVTAILCNVVRLVPLAWLYGRGPTPLVDTLHDLSGWIMLPLAFLLLLAVIRTMRWALLPVTPYVLAYDD